MDRAKLLKDISTLVTMDLSHAQEAGVLSDVDILIGIDGKIASIGKDLSCSNADVFELRNRVVIPGFINAHDHLWQSLIRGLAPQSDLTAWLPKMYDFAHAIREKEAYAAVALSAAHMLDMGVTTVLDWCHGTNLGFLRGNVEALTNSGLRWGIAYAGPKTASAEAYLGDACRHPLSIGHHQYASHPIPELVEDITTSAEKGLANNSFINVHFLESESQVAERPEEILRPHLQARSKLILNHAVHVTQKHLDALSCRIGVVHCPMSNLRLASGIFDDALFRRNGIPVGIGLDGGTNDAGDIFETIRVAVGLQRAKAKRADVSLTYSTALQMATIDGAKALGIDAHVGSLQVGKFSDLVVLDTETFNAPCAPFSVESMMLTMNSKNIEHVMIGGVWKKFENKVMSFEAASMMSNARLAYQELVERMS